MLDANQGYWHYNKQRNRLHNKFTFHIDIASGIIKVTIRADKGIPLQKWMSLELKVKHIFQST